MTGVVIHVARAGNTREFHAFFEQKFMDIQQAAAWENFLKLIFLQLIHAGATTYHYRLDIKVVQCVGHAMEQNPILGGDLVAFVRIASRRLRVAAA